MRGSVEPFAKRTIQGWPGTKLHSQTLPMGSLTMPGPLPLAKLHCDVPGALSEGNAICCATPSRPCTWVLG